MPLDPIAAGLLQQMAEAGMPPLNEMSPADARSPPKASASSPASRRTSPAWQDIAIPGPGGDIPVRVYTPSGDAARCRASSTTTAAAGCSATSRASTPPAVRWPTRPGAWWCRWSTASRPSTSSRPRSTTACAA